MRVIEAVKDAQDWAFAARDQRLTIGLVPTMGALHEGHLSLIRRAHAENDLVAVSIFVNPTQFGPTEDYARYPRQLETDCKVAEQAGASIVFAPTPEEMYTQHFATWVEVERLTRGLCGAFRPGHFRGVATVVAKLLNILLPHRAYFGQKDAQQLVVIRRMVEDLNFPVEIVACPTVREADGLALSSRNLYLSPEERAQAPVLYRALKTVERLIKEGHEEVGDLKAEAMKVFSEAPLARVEYFEIVDPQTLEPIEKVEGPVLVAVAAWFGSTRLIDNVFVA